MIFLIFQKEKKIKPYLLILPQINDVEDFIRNKKTYYHYLIEKFKTDNNIIDLTPEFAVIKNYKKLYVNDKYGGHLSSMGNKFVSKILEKRI